jgi:hypothetical protein
MTQDIDAYVSITSPSGEMAGDAGTLSIASDGLEWAGRRSYPIPWMSFSKWGAQEKGVFRPRQEISVITQANFAFRFDCGRKSGETDAFVDALRGACPMEPW